jgi:hypothetical protein
MTTSRVRRLAAFALTWIGVGAVTLISLEVALRLAFPGRLAVLHGLPYRTGEETLVRMDPNQGWSQNPNVSTTFRNGAVSASVHTDERGLRLNAATTTVVPEAPNIFLIGDSNTVQLEVNDAETVSALIETFLRQRGVQVNVRNLGVRGYGTDQAVLRALAFGDLQPRHIVYTFTNNDLGDNNAIHKPGRQHGKGVFVRRPGQPAFEAHNYPVPAYPPEFLSLVILDGQCQPVVYERTLPADELTQSSFSLAAWIKEYLWSARVVSLLRARPWWEQGSQDPSVEELAQYKGWGWMDGVYQAFYEKGPLRNRCPAYLEAQMMALLGRLRELPGVQSVSVVHFPDAQTLRDPGGGSTSPSAEMFRRFQEAGIIDGYLHLGQKLVESGIGYQTFACTGDGWHFCANGTAWMAAEIDKAFGARLAKE